MVNLTDAIVLDILLRFPVKSLLRFRCVCKKWCSLIKTPHFIDRHLALQRAGGDEHLLVKRMVMPSGSSDGFDEYVLNCYGGFDSLSVLTAVPDLVLDIERHTGNSLVFAGYVNGIVCLSDYGTCIRLLNPALRESRTLPAPPFGCPSGLCGSTEAIGFGFDGTTNDYKVVRYIEYASLASSRRGHSEAEVYSMRTNSWRRLGNVPEYYIDSNCSPIYFNGCVHWLACLSDDVDDDIILCFNMSTELFLEMELPDDLKDYESEMLKGLIMLDKSTIALVAFTETSGWDTRGDFVNVWVMKEYGVPESWIKQYSITPSLKIEKPLTFWKKDKLVLVTRDGELVYCDLPTGELRQVLQYDPIEGEHSVARSLGMVICTESLFPIKQVLE